MSGQKSLRQWWLAEMNRRILAGRPIASEELEVLERLYGEVEDRWGPPTNVAGRHQAERTSNVSALLSALRPDGSMQ
jgi:hypothetical protein